MTHKESNLKRQVTMNQENLFKAKVTAMTDGDTFKVEIKGNESVVRIACINAPEMSDNPWGSISKDALTGMLKIGSTVRLLEHDTDRYGRTVAEVYKRKGKNIGLRLVKKGFAEVYDKYAYQCDEKKLKKAERKAKRKEKGLWADIEEQQPIEEPGPGDGDSESNIPAYTGSRMVTCSQLTNQQEAKEWLSHGHGYLDLDGDGTPCESLPAV